MRAAIVCCVLFGCASCGRTFQRLTTSLLAGDRIAVAPFEHVTLQVTGAVGTPRFAFRDDPVPSGGSIDGDVYVAGGAPFVVDVIEVTDESGGHAEISASVGAVLIVAPTDVSLAPRGSFELRPSGGKTPYSFSIVDPGTGSTLDPASGVFTAGHPTAVRDSEVVQIADATGDARAVVEVRVHITPAVALFAAGDVAVTPQETRQLIAVGGAAPYAYHFKDEASPGVSVLGSTLDIQTGVYVASARKGDASRTVVDEVVLAKDTNAEAAELTLHVGPILLASFVSDSPAPGIANRVQASGGRAPFDFAFDAKGNRSEGSIDTVTGVYVPGPNVGAIDRIVVTDSLGVAVTLVSAPVANLSYHNPFPSPQLAAADLSGSHTRSVLLQDQRNDTLALLRLGGDLSLRETLVFTAKELADAYWAVSDFNGDGREDLVFANPSSLGVMLGEPTGGLGAPVVLAPTAAMVPRLFVAGGNAYFVASNVGGICSILPSQLAIVRTTLAGPVQCVLPLAGASPGTFLKIFVVADLDGDGALDLAWNQAPSLDLETIFDINGAMTPAVAVTLPDPPLADLPGPETSVVLGAFDNTAPGLDLAMLLDPMSGGSNYPVVLGLAGATGWLPAPFLAPPPQDVRRIASDRHAGALDTLLGTVGESAFGLAGIGVVVGALAAATGFTGDGAPLSDFITVDIDGDGIDDLVEAQGPSLALFRGDGDGGFNRLAHFRLTDNLQPITFSDLDGDGLVDIVASNAGDTVALFSGSDGFIAASDRGGAPPAVVFQGQGISVVEGDRQTPLHFFMGTYGGGLWSVRREADGRLDPPVRVAVAGVPADHLLFAVAAVELGGAAPGADLVAYDIRTGAALPIVRTDDSTLTALTPPALPPGTAQAVHPLDANLDGLDDYIVRTVSGSGPSTINYLYAARTATGFAAFVPFAGGIVTNNTSLGGGILLGQLDRGRMVVLENDIIAVLNPSLGTPTLTSVTPAHAPTTVLLADVDGDLYSDLVYVDSVTLGLVVQRGVAGNPDGFAPPIVGKRTRGQLLGVGVLAPSGPAAAVFQSAAVLGGPGLPELTVWPGNGLGAFDP